MFFFLYTLNFIYVDLSWLNEIKGSLKLIDTKFTEGNNQIHITTI